MTYLRDDIETRRRARGAVQREGINAEPLELNPHILIIGMRDLTRVRLVSSIGPVVGRLPVPLYYGTT